jgi:putative acetyltransferase
MQPEVRALLAQSDEYSMARYPIESQYLVDADFLAQSNVRFLVARLDGRAVGCGALVVAHDGSAELKRMIVDADARGRGVGRAILAALEAVARREHLRIIRLETGTLNQEAVGLYRACGYQERGPFAGYTDDPLSVFMEKDVAA